MNLLLWRHADAEALDNDLARQLTIKGKEQARKMAQWINAHFYQDYTCWVSQAKRTQQTASYLTENMVINSKLNPGANVQKIIDELAKLKSNTDLILVGHQPWIGKLALFLINGYHYPNSYLSFKKANIWWLENKDGFNHASSFFHLKAVLSPALLKESAAKKTLKRSQSK
jgi:probable hydrolase protein